MRKFLILFSSFLFLQLASNVAFACSCSPSLFGETETQRIEAAYEKAQAVFSGKVLKIKKSKSFNELQVTFRVSETWKGATTERIVVTTESLCCSGCPYNFNVGKTYLVYAYTWEGSALGTNQCTRTKKMSEAERDLKVLGKGKAPQKAQA